MRCIPADLRARPRVVHDQSVIKKTIGHGHGRNQYTTGVVAQIQNDTFQWSFMVALHVFNLFEQFIGAFAGEVGDLEVTVVAVYRSAEYTGNLDEIPYQLEIGNFSIFMRGR